MPLLDVGGQQLNVLDEGSGEPLLFLHAFPLNAAMWQYQIDALADRYRVVAIDLPGFGGSPAPDPKATAKACTMERYADVVADVVRQLDLAPVVLVGASMGGYIAFAVVRQHPGILRALVLADTRSQSDDAATWQRRTKQQERLRGDADLEAMAKDLTENLLGRDSLGRPELVEYVTALMASNDRTGWICALEAMKKRQDSISTLGSVGVPTLVVVGAQDRLTPQTESTLIQARVKDSRLVVVPSAGHLPNVENPIAFNEALSEFLASL